MALKLIKQRGFVKQRLTKLNNFVKIDTNSADQKLVRMTKLEEIYNEYIDCHRQLVEIDADPAERDNDYDDFESMYYDLKLYHTDLVAKSTVNKMEKIEVQPVKHIPVKLPDVKLKTFNGDFDKWIIFRNNFTSLIHNRTDLDNIQKFSYLQGVLEDDAARLVEKISLTETGYVLAWETITSRYDNNRAIVDHHISQLLNTKPIKTGNATELQTLIDTFSNRVGELKHLNQPIEHWDMILVNILSPCLDPESRKAWEFKVGASEFPTFDQLKLFMNERAQVLRNVQRPVNQGLSASAPSFKPSGRMESVKQSQQTTKSFVTNTQKRSSNSAFSRECCVFCQSLNHYKLQCETFLQKSSDDRMKLVNDLKLCVNCFRKHEIEQCESRGCKLCNLKHHTLLHVYFDGKLTTSDSPSMGVCHSSTATNESSIMVCEKKETEVVLSTAIVFMKDVSGTYQKCRVLLDSGSQSNFITQELADLLRLRKYPAYNRITGLDNMSTIINFKIAADVKSRIDDFSFHTEFLIVPKITKLLPTNVIKLSDNFPTEILLADPEFVLPGKIDALIGAEIFLTCIKEGRIVLDDGQLVLQNSSFGYIAGGKISSSHIFTCLNEPDPMHDELNHLVKQFWELESISSKKLLTPEESACEMHFSQNHYRNPDGRYGVRLPFRPDVKLLGNSVHVAKRRFNHLESKLQKHDELKLQYVKFMDEYSRLGHMSQLGSSDLTSSINESCEQYLLPHHAVLKPSSTTTKLRVVFDASAKTTSGNSLNDILMTGPTIQDDLFSIVLRFRRHRYAFTADIEKMYRMIEIHPDDRKFQRILWRQSPDDPLKVYELNTVTYGSSSAPYLATRVLRQLATDEVNNYPCAAAAIEDFYMDDIMTGSDDFQTASVLLSQLNAMLQSAGMTLRKYCSNSNDLLNLVPESNREVIVDDTSDNTIQPIKTLGLIWETNADQFHIDIKCPELDTVITKRAVLSKIAGIFDPLGVVGPVIAKAKIFLQQLWVLNVGWDDPLPVEQREFWTEFCDQLPVVRSIQLPRCITPTNMSHLTYELHGFCDASLAAYGAVIFIRCIDDGNESHTNILCSKSKVAPLKKITIPRLELCGATLLTHLVEKVVSAMKINFSQIYLWCDSTIVLNWIKTPCNQLKTFVGNRVSEIQNLELPVKWLHVDTESNPADPLSRGLMPNELQSSSLWFHGPPNWDELLSSKTLPILSPDCSDFKQEIISPPKLTFLTKTDVNDFKANVIDKYSEFEHLVNVVAYVNRFINNMKQAIHRKSSSIISSKDSSIGVPKREMSNYVTVAERRDSVRTITRLVQQQHFDFELRALAKRGEVDCKSQIRNLNPFVDENGLLRVGGRINKSNLTYAAKHPLILPKDDHYTTVVFRYYHKINLHCGPQALLSHVRQQFWTVRGKTVAKSITRQCITCFKMKPAVAQQLMGELPQDRVTPSSPFAVCGVDYCGPFLTATNIRRNTTTKSYVAIFVCFATKAIHIEVVSNLTSECFKSALKRFVARRGKPSVIHSDNGTNFVGAANDINTIQSFLNSNKGVINQYCATEQIVWKFIPPRSPHFGGLWEAGVKSFKHHFRRVTHQKILTVEELQTLAIQIEGCLNSRPITPLSDDPNDYQALTPGHFLIGRPITAVPELPDDVPVINNLKYWRQLSRMKQLFWQRWSFDFISEMQRRTKWMKPHTNIDVGDLVLVRQEGLPSCEWLTGRVINLNYGTDGRVRVATLTTKNGELVRAVQKLCPFPKQDTLCPNRSIES